MIKCIVIIFILRRDVAFSLIIVHIKVTRICVQFNNHAKESVLYHCDQTQSYYFDFVKRSFLWSWKEVKITPLVFCQCGLLSVNGRAILMSNLQDQFLPQL